MSITITNYIVIQLSNYDYNYNYFRKWTGVPIL